MPKQLKPMGNLKLPPQLRDTISRILGAHIFTVSREDALMQAATAVLDATQELETLRLTVETLRGEIRTLVAIQMKQRGVDKLILTRKEFEAIPLDVTVKAEAPEPGIRVYTLIRRPETATPIADKNSPLITDAVRRALN